MHNVTRSCRFDALLNRRPKTLQKTQIGGNRFFTGTFSRLNEEQLHFVEAFVRNEGKITRMEEEFSLSYPTIRSRLHEVIRALGYEPGKEGPTTLTEEERRQILEDLDSGKITSEEAMKMLEESQS